VNGKEVKKKFRKGRIKIDDACRKYSNEKNILQMREMVFVAPASRRGFCVLLTTLKIAGETPAPQEIKVMA